MRYDADTNRSVPLCNGLLHDWSSWIKARDANAAGMAAALRALSPHSEGGDEVVCCDARGEYAQEYQVGQSTMYSGRSCVSMTSEGTQ